MPDTKISDLPLRTVPLPTDEVATAAGGINYRTPLSSLTTGALYDASSSGVAGDGSTDDRATLLAADGIALALSSDLLINAVCKVNSNLTLTSRVQFGPGGRLKPASGVMVTLAGGFTAPPNQHVFDISLGGDVFSTQKGPVTARNYGAIGNNVANDRLPLQHLIDSCLYFQKQPIVLDAGGFFVSGGPLIVNYGSSFRGTSMYGAGHAIDGAGAFPGTSLKTDWQQNLLEVHGCRSMLISGIGFEGPFYNYIMNTRYGTVPEGGEDAGYTGDPRDHMQWLPPEARAAGVLNRYKMCSAIHIDPRSTDPHNTIGLKPTPVWKTDVRLVVKSELDASSYENGDSVQGVTLATGDRILQAVSIDVDGWPGLPSNGVWVVQATGKPVRATDLDTSAELVNNAAVNCTAGTYAGTKWVCNTAYLSEIDAPYGYAYGYAYNIDFRQFDGELCYADYDYPAWAGITGQYGKVLSSDVTVAHCDFKGFGCALAVKGCNADGNADFVRINHSGGQYNVYSFAWGHTQARNQGVSDSQFGQARVHFSGAVIGRQLGGQHCKVSNCCIDGAIDILDFPAMGIMGCVSLDSCYVEGGYRFGRASSTGYSGSLEINGGTYGMHAQVWMKRVPRWVLDCRQTGVVMQPTVTIILMTCPLIIWADPRVCHIDAQLGYLMWMDTPPGQNPGTPQPTVSKADAIMKGSTMDVVFLNTRQGPWDGGGYNFPYQFTTAGATANLMSRLFDKHAVSNVVTPIPFCAETVGTTHWTGGDITSEPYVVALGDRAFEAISGNAAYFSAPATLVGRTLTLNFNPAQLPNAAVAMNQGIAPGCIIFTSETNQLFVITTVVGAVVTAKLLGNYEYTTGPMVPQTQLKVDEPLYFIPTGHYIPDSGPELTFTAGSSTVTYKDAEGDVSMGAQFPVGSVKMVHNSLDVGTPILRNSATVVTSSTPGTIVLSGNARAAPEGTARTRPGIWFVPR